MNFPVFTEANLQKFSESMVHDFQIFSDPIELNKVTAGLTAHVCVDYFKQIKSHRNKRRTYAAILAHRVLNIFGDLKSRFSMDKPEKKMVSNFIIYQD